MSVTESLIQIQNLLGESYYKIGDSLKTLKDEVDSTLSESETVVLDFRNNLKAAAEGSLSSVVIQLEDKVSDARKNHKEYTEQFLSVMSRIFNSFEVLNNMHKPIGKIIESAEQMELLALNAMVVAIQAGNQGGGFTCITDGFQKNAKTAFSLAGNLNKQRSIVSEQFEALKSESENVLDLQKKISADIKNSLTNDFESLKKVINSAVDFIEIVFNEAQQMKHAVNTIFEGLQNQDIIRQSMDHMLLSLEELDKVGSESSGDEEIYLRKKLYDLCYFVLDEVIQQLNTDENTLKKNTERMKNLLAELEEKKEKFTEEQFTATVEEQNLINCLSNISSTFDSIISDSEDVCDFQTEIIKYKSKLLKSFAQLHEYITAFHDPVALFNNTIILARIEIARQPVIKNVETSINDISGEVKIIADCANEIELIYNDFHLVNREIDIELRKIISENNNFTDNFKKEIKKLTDLSEQSGIIFRELLKDLRFFNTIFSSIFSDIKGNIKLISKSRDSLENMKYNIQRELDEINKKFVKIDTDKLSALTESKEIDKLLKKFTIFRHKEKVLNEEISEQTASESSITLF